VVTALSTADGIEAIWLVGYSLGGNLVLKMAGEVGSTLLALKGVVAVSPSIDPAACVEALERPSNWIYHRSFVAYLRARIRRKARLFPGRFDLSPLAAVRTLRQLDETYTAPDGGYASAADYYERSGARHVLGAIKVLTLIITAQDDPCVPYRQFETSILHGNPRIRLAAPTHGGHCGFLQRPRAAEDVFWAENRLVDFITAHHARRW
jgi:predicted alpha/beta-fold hydrolase